MAPVIAVAIALVGAAASGCGSSSSSSSPKTSPTSSSSGSESSGGAALARQINLRLSDFPSGWQATQPTGGQGFQEFLACLHVSTASQTADVSSPSFSPKAGQSGGGGSEASSEVLVQTTAAAAQAAYASLSGPGVPGCLQSVLTKEATSSSLPAGTTTSITVAPLPGPAAGGNPASAYQVNISAQAQGQTTPAGVGTLVFFAHGRVLVEFDTLALFGQAFPANLQGSLLSALANRANSSRA